jgi:hypothetical protein
MTKIKRTGARFIALLDSAGREKLPNGNSTQVLFTFAEDAAQLIFFAFEVCQQNSEDT